MMDKYITQEEVFTRLCNRHCAVAPYECNFKVTHNGNPGCFTANDIANIPAADVRPVVFCRDCRFWGGRNGKNECSLITSLADPRIWLKTQPDDFCSSGERRDAKMGGVVDDP